MPEDVLSACKKWFFRDFVLTGIAENTIMRALLMSEPAVIDSLEFARTAQRASGTVAVVALTRVADHLFDDQGTLDYTITGGSDKRNRPSLHVEVHGEIHLRCQRCLGRLPYRLDTASDLPVLTNGGSNDDRYGLNDLDGIAADPHTDVLTLVEDEVLLAMPMVPRHQEGQCNVALGGDAAQKMSPFAGLARLK